MPNYRCTQRATADDGEGLPFDMIIPTPLTRQTIQSTDEGRDLIVCKDAADMFKKLGL